MASDSDCGDKKDFLLSGFTRKVCSAGLEIVTRGGLRAICLGWGEIHCMGEGIARLRMDGLEESDLGECVALRIVEHA